MSFYASGADVIDEMRRNEDFEKTEHFIKDVSQSMREGDFSRINDFFHKLRDPGRIQETDLLFMTILVEITEPHSKEAHFALREREHFLNECKDQSFEVSDLPEDVCLLIDEYRP